MRVDTQPLRLTCVVTLVALAAGHTLGAQQTPPATIQLLRIASGPRGSEAGGQFRLDEERSVFNRSIDTQVVVFFQWEGPPGSHRMAGRWRNPRGDVSISEFEYNARDRRFGAYWTLPISPSTSLGEWSIEATVDGLPSGKAVFEITDGDRSVVSAVQKRPLAPSDVYERASAIYVTIERITPREHTDSVAGFVLSSGRIATAFGALDAVERAYAIAPRAERQEITSLVAWSRNQDWAIIPAESATGTAIPVAAADAPKVGDRCYSIQGSASGRVLTECSIVGVNRGQAGTDRFVASFLTGFGVPGAPVLNEYGELIGAVGAGRSAGLAFGGFLSARAEVGGVPIVPLTLFRALPTSEQVSLQELRTRNVFMAAVKGGDNVLSAGFARDIQRSPVRPIDQREHFSVQESRFFVFVGWDPKERLRGSLILRVFDDDNRLLVETKPMKVDLKPTQLPFSQWDLSTPQKPGRYRVDIVFGDAPIWRGFVQITA